jgi:hypothetical protein
MFGKMLLHGTTCKEENPTSNIGAGDGTLIASSFEGKAL